MASYKGRFRPKNPSKYKGDPTNIIYRSFWEFKVFRFCDSHPDIIWWASEEINIRYKSPLDNKIHHRYFPDILLKKKVGEDAYEILLIEIKPKNQTKQPDPKNKNKTPTGRVSRRYLKEVKTFAINKAKWDAAERYCKERGWRFVIMTEDDIKP